MTKYKYNDDSIIAGYIRELLHDFNLPAYKVYKQGQPKYNGRKYIYDNKIVVYKKNSTTGEDGKFETIQQYIFGMPINNVTTKLPLHSSIYDTQAHVYLGNYLRFIRDAKGLNLMPLYNCYLGVQGDNFNYALDIPFTKEGEETSYLFNVNTDDKLNDYYIAQAKFGYDYTIGIDAQVPFEICCIINTGDKVLYDSKKLSIATYKRYPGASFRYPVIYSTKFDASMYWQYEENLQLLIKVPKIVKSSLTVLEGNYLKNCDTAGARLLQHGDEVEGDIQVISKLSLLRINTIQSYPFANRLVEYLLGNAITNVDDIKGNVYRVQQKIYNDPKYEGSFKGFEDIWDNNIVRRINEILLYDNRNDFVKLKCGDVITQNKLRNQDIYFDLLGYVDKDIEYIIEAW